MSPYILLGFLIAGLLHVFVKPSAMSRHLAGGGLKPVVKAALFGIPLPLCSCGVLPTAVALRRQGCVKGRHNLFSHSNAPDRCRLHSRHIFAARAPVCHTAPGGRACGCRAPEVLLSTVLPHVPTERPIPWRVTRAVCPPMTNIAA